MLIAKICMAVLVDTGAVDTSGSTTDWTVSPWASGTPA
jgi:hypothetical protein